MPNRPITRAIAATIAIAVIALALMGAAWRSEPSAPAAAVPYVGVPTGEYVQGVEVQRLPSITVTARRSDVR
ncbi:MAG: hypothetical protein IT532_07240 [Burkholderiales bacterium]|nr:hypothetical protein [Burkholderiales bacterium]